MRVIERRLDIQGVRAIAVLAVLFFHALPEGPLKGGFIGVDIFFVISGFLITLVIRSSYIEGRFSLPGFYRRRARRLLPALFFVVLSTLAAGAVFLSPNGYLQLGKSVIPALAFVSNFYFSNNVDYFDADAEKQPLLHTWSLSVEEQFYLIYPLVLVAILRRGERSWPVSMMALTVLSTMVLSEALVRYDPSWSYFASPARAFELLIGCSAALLSTRFSLPSLQANLLSAGGAVLMIGSLLLIDRESAIPGLLAAIPCLGTAAILLAGANGRPVASRLLANPLLVMVGNVSYSMYLWHWPILALARSHFGLTLPAPVAWAAIGLTAVLSYVSFRWIEQPFLKREAGGWPIFRLAAGSAAALAIFAITVKLTGGIPQRFSPETNALFAAAEDRNPVRKRCSASSRRPFPPEEDCVFGASPPRTAVWGDSHGVEMAYALGEHADELGHGVMQITVLGCPPIQGFEQPGRPLCRPHNAATLTYVMAAENLRTVVLYAHLQNKRYGGRASLMKGYEETVRSLAGAGKTVVMAVPIPTYEFDVPERLGMYHALGLELASVAMSRSAFEDTIAPIRLFLNDLAGKYPGTRVFDPTDQMCNEITCRTFDERLGSLYFDKGHVSLSAARALAVPLLSVVRAGNAGSAEQDCNDNPSGETRCGSGTPDTVAAGLLRL